MKWRRLTAVESRLSLQVMKGGRYISLAYQKTYNQSSLSLDLPLHRVIEKTPPAKPPRTAAGRRCTHFGRTLSNGLEINIKGTKIRKIHLADRGDGNAGGIRRRLLPLLAERRPKPRG
jgi:hypothetical protein